MLCLGHWWPPLIRLGVPPAPRPTAGNCWLRQARNGRCQVLYKTDLSKEECCKSGRLTTSWTAEDVNDNTLFKWMIFNGGAPNCIPCKGEGVLASCSGSGGAGLGEEGRAGGCRGAALSSRCLPGRGFGGPLVPAPGSRRRPALLPAALHIKRRRGETPSLLPALSGGGDLP